MTGENVTTDGAAPGDRNAAPDDSARPAPDDELRSALQAFLFQREELRCAELQDRHGLVVACVFGAIFVVSIFWSMAAIANSLIAGRFIYTVFPLVLGLISVLGFYLVKNAYDYGRRSYKVALNLSKDRAERLARVLPGEGLGAILQVTR
ncbi:MAG: hypothetical protein M3M96_01315 [Candidatus Eremiobacteraeota bacterium]|nr:hypothetical protein [Candidatus Eremiobacteraeota bacterium]